MLTVLNASLDPFYNLAFEEYVCRRFPEDDVFLLWRNAPCVVVGCYQNICGEVHVGQLRQMGVPVLRRISGGGTVYHDPGNVNYSLILNGEGVDYERCLRPVIDALNDLGAPAERARTCDIAVRGRKVSGSAQWSSKGRLLHHGTLLFDADLGALDRITTRHKGRGCSSKGTASAICEVANLREFLPPMDVGQFCEALLARVLPADAPRIALTSAQDAEVRRLRDEKYASWAWIWGKNPAFALSRDGEFAGAPFSIGYRARKGVISEVQVRCGALDAPRLERLLDGARLDPDGFMQICGEVAGSRAEELFGLLL